MEQETPKKTYSPYSKKVWLILDSDKKFVRSFSNRKKLWNHLHGFFSDDKKKAFHYKNDPNPKKWYIEHTFTPTTGKRIPLVKITTNYTKFCLLLGEQNPRTFYSKMYGNISILRQKP